MIRLGAPSSDPTLPSTGAEAEPTAIARRGFDYEAFQTRLESLWFQRKALLADGRESDAAEQGELIRAFCREEGVRRLEHMAGALLAEAHRYIEEGHYQRALDSLALAEAVHPGRPQIHAARAGVYWNMNGRTMAAGAELLRAFRGSLGEALASLTLFKQLALVLAVAVAAGVFLFAALMLLRYQSAFRHDVEEWIARTADPRLAGPAGWAALLMPLLVWVAAGWAALYWIAVLFRYMQGRERLTALALLLASTFALPIYRLSATIYGATSDPLVRTTLASADGAYDPDRILKLRELVEAHPDDVAYRFLLAGLYRNGGYFQDAYVEYKAAVELEPTLVQAHINIGNIFYTTGQHSQAIAHYTRAVEIRPGSVLAYFNMHLAQSEAFRFREAEASLNRAREIDPAALGDLLAASAGESVGPTSIDATLKVGSIWGAALGGRGSLDGDRRLATAAGPGVFHVGNAISIASLVALAVCLWAGFTSRGDRTARRCIRCGAAFCYRCKGRREAHEYCSQCLHLFVLGEGLAPETKTRKIYEVERYERRNRRVRRLLSWLLPGSAQVLRGRALAGTALLMLTAGGLVAWQPGLFARLGEVADLSMRLDLLGVGPVPSMFGFDALPLLGLLCVVICWFAGNAGFLRRREV